jgi:putative phosphoesterase
LGVKIGILSDTHSRFSIALEAVRLLQQAGAEELIHCGDVGEERVLDALVGLPAAFVFGNNDYDRDGLRKYAGLIGVHCLGAYGVLERAGKRLAVTHGDDFRLISRLQRPPTTVDYLFTGHTHVRHDQRINGVRCINPGALYRAAIKSVALLDLSTDTLTFLNVPEP